MEDQIGAIQDHPGAVEACPIEVLTWVIQAYPRDAKVHPGDAKAHPGNAKAHHPGDIMARPAALQAHPWIIEAHSATKVKSHLAVIKAHLRTEKLTLELNSSFCSGSYFGVLGSNPEPWGIPWSTGGYPKAHGHMLPTIDQLEDLDANFDAKRSLPCDLEVILEQRGLSWPHYIDPGATGARSGNMITSESELVTSEVGTQLFLVQLDQDQDPTRRFLWALKKKVVKWMFYHQISKILNFIWNFFKSLIKQ